MITTDKKFKFYHYTSTASQAENKKSKQPRSQQRNEKTTYKQRNEKTAYIKRNEKTDWEGVPTQVTSRYLTTTHNNLKEIQQKY